MLPIKTSVSLGQPLIGATEYRLSTRVAAQPATEVVVTSPATSKTVTKDIATGQTFYAKVKACTAIWCGDYSAEATFVMPAKPATPSILGIQLIISGQ